MASASLRAAGFPRGTRCDALPRALTIEGDVPSKYPRTILQNEGGKKVGCLEGDRNHESSNGRDWMGVVREGFMEEGDIPEGFSTQSQAKRTTWKNHEEDLAGRGGHRWRQKEGRWGGEQARPPTAYGMEGRWQQRVNKGLS